MKDRIKKILKKRFKISLALASIFMIFTFVFSFFNAKIISVSFSEESIRKLLLKKALVPTQGNIFIDIMQDMTSFMNVQASTFWFSTILLLSSIVVFYLIFAVVHELMWNFNFNGIGKKGISKVALELILGLFFLGILVGIITGVPLQAIWFAFIIYYIVTILIFWMLLSFKWFKVEEIPR